MSKRKDKQILEILKEEVILRSREIENLKHFEATKEALAELTGLPPREVDRIHAKIEYELQKKEQKRKKQVIIFAGFAVLAAIAVVSAFFLFLNEAEPARFSEEFKNNDNSWQFKAETQASAHYYSEGGYFFDTRENKSDVDYIQHNLKLPEIFSIEIETEFIGGKTDSYGLYIGENADNFAYFFIRSDGYRRAGFATDGTWVPNDGWIFKSSIKSGKNLVNKIEIEIRKGKYRFLVNEQEVAEGSMQGIKANYYSIAVSNRQHIRFDNLLIKNPKGDTLYYNTFEKEQEPWLENSEIISNAEITGDAYRITNNKKGACKHAVMEMPEIFSDKEYEILAEARIKELKENAGFGLIVMKDEHHFHELFIENGKKARVNRWQIDHFSYKGNYNAVFTKKKTYFRFKIVVHKKTIHYYVNEKLVQTFKKSDIPFNPEIKQIGFRVCDRQVVEFEHLEIREILRR